MLALIMNCTSSNWMTLTLRHLWKERDKLPAFCPPPRAGKSPFPRKSSHQHLVGCYSVVWDGCFLRLAEEFWELCCWMHSVEMLCHHNLLSLSLAKSARALIFFLCFAVRQPVIRKQMIQGHFFIKTLFLSVSFEMLMVSPRIMDINRI